VRSKQNSLLVLNLVSVIGGKMLDSISIKNSAAPISVWTLQRIFLTVNFACCFHRDISMVEELKKVKENELSMMGFEPTLTDPAGYPVLTAALHTQKLVPPRGIEPRLHP
jgi:hypothetical protein